MWLILLVPQQVNNTFWATFYESVALFSKTQHLGTPVIPMDGSNAKETKYSPTNVHFKDYGAMDACSGTVMLFEQNSLWDNFWILMWSQRSEPFSPGPELWRVTDRLNFCWGRGEDIHSWTGPNVFDVMAQEEVDSCQRFWTFLDVVPIFAHPSLTVWRRSVVSTEKYPSHMSAEGVVEHFWKTHAFWWCIESRMSAH